MTNRIIIVAIIHLRYCVFNLSNSGGFIRKIFWKIHDFIDNWRCIYTFCGKYFFKKSKYSIKWRCWSPRAKILFLQKVNAIS